GAELAPAHARLDAADEHDVALAPRRPGDVHLRRGPGDPADAVLPGADLWPVDLEVVEVLRVQRADQPGVPDVDEVIDDAGRGAGGVVPALEGAEQDRTDQPLDLLDLDHDASLATGDHVDETSARSRASCPYTFRVE